MCIAKIYAVDKSPQDHVFNPIEKFLFRISGIDAKQKWTGNST